MKNSILSVALALYFASSIAKAQSTEERFQDLFVTAGYSTAFGAALGAAFLSFTSNPAQNVKYVAVGASAGFIGGSILGSYLIFSPVFITEHKKTEEGLSFSMVPYYDQSSKSGSMLTALSWTH